MSHLLFLCTGNSCRSQMAEGFARAIAPNDIKIMSAGLEAKGLHPKAIEVMAEVGIDISHQKSKTLADLDSLAFDVVITLCEHARENCPALPGAPGLIHWALPDPTEAKGTEEEMLSQVDIFPPWSRRSATPNSFLTT